MKRKLTATQLSCNRNLKVPFIPSTTNRKSERDTNTTKSLTQFKATFRKDESKAFCEGNTLDATMGTDTERSKADRIHPRKSWNNILTLASRSVPSFGCKQENKMKCHRHSPPEYSQQTEGAPLARLLSSQSRVLITTEPKTSHYNIQMQRDEPRLESSLCYQRHLYSILLFIWQGYK